MNFLRLIGPALTVLRAGRSLKNPAMWKNAQTLANIIAALVAIGTACGVPMGLSNDAVLAIAGGIAAAANAYFTVATSEKVGLSNVLPPIELVGKSQAGGADAQPGPGPGNAGYAADQLRQPVRPVHNTDEAADNNDFPGWGS